jgi:large subunit ribosomal protein L33
MREKVILICEECLSRNYTVDRNKLISKERMVLRKYCPKCNKHTIHKETK